MPRQGRSCSLKLAAVARRRDKRDAYVPAKYSDKCSGNVAHFTYNDDKYNRPNVCTYLMCVLLRGVVSAYNARVA